MTIKKSIGWTNATINPIKGKCKGGCWYCWTKPLYKRKFLQPELRLETRVFSKLPKTPKKIFLCSTHDLFGDWIVESWRGIIFEYIKLFPQHTFQILTKFPQNIDREMPNNVWLGVTITRDEDIWRRNRLVTSGAKVKFISFEPLLGTINMKYGLLQRIHWVIFGKLTGHGKNYDPTKKQLNRMMWDIRGNPLGYSPPIFLKDNLRTIWGENLIQEMPK